MISTEKVLPLIHRHSPMNHRMVYEYQQNDHRRRHHDQRRHTDEYPKLRPSPQRHRRRHQPYVTMMYHILFITICILNASFLVLHHAYYYDMITTDFWSHPTEKRRMVSLLSLSSIAHKSIAVNHDIDDEFSHPPTPSGITYYSRGRHDRSGAVVHDMLWVHAYAFAQNGTYGGACGGPELEITFNGEASVGNTNHTRSKIMTHQNVTQELLNQLHWNRALKYACPLNYSISTTEIIVERDFYTSLNASTFTPQWKAYFQSQITMEQMDTSFTRPVPALATTHNDTQRSDEHDGITGKMTTTIKKRQASIVQKSADSKSCKTTRSTNDTLKTSSNDIAVYTIAVHIRRGDVDPCTYMNRYLSNEYYLKLIKKYYKQVPKQYQKVVVDIYSESSSYESFDVFQKVYKYNVHLDDTLYNVWYALSTANVAILSKSSFSYVPAIINPNFVVYTSYRHLPLPSWQVVNTTISDAEKRNVKYIHDHEC